MPRPPKKKTRVLAEAETTGKLKAKDKHKSKIFKNKKQMKAWIIEQLEKLIARIDPLELTAVMGATVIIKTGIDWSEEILKQFEATSKETWWKLVFPVETIMGMGYDALFQQLTGKPREQMRKEMEGQVYTEVMEWIVSFCIAYVVIHNFGALIDAGTSLLGSAKMLLGMPL